MEGLLSTGLTPSSLYLEELSLTVWAWRRRKAVGGKGSLNKLMIDGGVFRAAPGFARVC